MVSENKENKSYKQNMFTGLQINHHELQHTSDIGCKAVGNCRKIFLWNRSQHHSKPFKANLRQRNKKKSAGAKSGDSAESSIAII